MIEKWARLSDCEQYRYTLYRRWNKQTGLAVFLMFNPSTADADKDDATIRKCIGFTSHWGYGAVGVVNLFAFRSRFPAALQYQTDPVGPQTNYWIERVLTDAQMLVCAWGCDTQFRGEVKKKRIAEVMQRISVTYPRLPIMCLGLTQYGSPRHPLVLPYITKLVPYAWV